MSGRWGNLDRKSIIFVLDNGCACVLDKLKHNSASMESLENDYHDLCKLLENEGKTMLSRTNQLRFESRLRTIKKIFRKRADAF